MPSRDERIVLVGGHESDHGADLRRLERVVPGSCVVGPGRQLHEVVTAGRRAGRAVFVVPMTFGRDPAMVADTAKSLRWLAGRHDGPLALTAPFGVLDHLTAHLRAAAARARADDPDGALVVAARASNPFDDAELHRVAHLVRVHGAGTEVAVATLDGDDEITAVLDRLRRLGFDRSTVVPAGFAARLEVDGDDPGLVGMTQRGPLLGDAAVARIITERVGAARQAWQHGDDGIAAGLAADHGHGYAHSHSHDHQQPHRHDHDHVDHHRDDGHDHHTVAAPA